MEKDSTEQPNQNEHGIISIVQAPDRAKKTSGKPKKSVTETKSSKEKKHGIISIVQSPDEEKNESGTEKKSDEQDDHGIVSTVQSPEEVKNRKEPMPKSPTMNNQKQDYSQRGGMNNNGSKKGMPKAKLANINGSEKEILDYDDDDEVNLYEEGTLREMQDEITEKSTRKGRM